MRSVLTSNNLTLQPTDIRKRDNTRAMADKYAETNCQPGDLIKLTEIEINSASLAAREILRSDQGEGRGIFPPCYYDEFESHSPE